MLDKKVSALLNEQVMHELYSAYLYLDMADHYGHAGLEGFENWFYIQAQEERDHAMLFRKYLMNNGEKVTLLPIKAPQENYTGHDVPLKRALEHERLVTSLIHTIFDAALAAKDYRTMEFLNWFVKEQGEEEKNADTNIVKYELVKDGSGLYVLDQEMAARAYSAPSLVLD